MLHDTPKITEARELAFKLHNNQPYDTDKYHPFHLRMVEEIIVEYAHIDEDITKDIEPIRIAGLFHDVIEDTYWNYADVRDKFGELIADLVYAVTDEKGKNRPERHNEKFWNELRSDKRAIYIKLCDRIANFRYSISVEDKKFMKLYHKEVAILVKELYEEDVFAELWNELNRLLTVADSLTRKKKK